MQVSLLANPWSGRGVGPRRAELVAHALNELGWETELFVGQSRNETVEWGARVAGLDGKLVVVGGDGTLNAVVEGLVRDGRTPLPPTIQLGLGTSNLLMHELRLPHVEQELARCVHAGFARPLDLGALTLEVASAEFSPTRPSFLVWDFGLGGALMKAMDEVRTGPIRKSDYARMLPRVLRRWKPTPQRVVADGVDLGEFEYGIISGIRTYASPALRLPPCEHGDGLWELYLLPRASKRRLVGLGIRTLLRRMKKTPGLVYRQARHVRVFGDSPAPVQIDGDYYGTTPVEFELTGQQLPVLLPQAKSS